MTVGGSDSQDWLTLHVPSGMALGSLVLATYVSTDAQGFIGVQAGTAFVGSAFTASSYLGYAHFGTGAANGSLPPTNLVGDDLLPIMGNTSLASGSQGFTPPLSSGDYTFLIQQLGSSTAYQFDFVTSNTASPDMVIAMSHAASFSQGDAADSYTIVASNSGSAATTGAVTVTDTIPNGLTPTAANSGTINGWSVSKNGQTVTATRSDPLASGASYPNLPIIVAVAANAPANVVNTATVSGGGETNTSNDSASDPTSITQLPDLTITKSHSGNFTQGDASDTYSITVGNAGSAATSGTVTVNDTLPAGLTPTADDNGTIDGWSVLTSGQTITATRGDSLSTGASYQVLTLTVSVDGDAPARVTNTATVSGGGETNTSNDSASDPTTIIAIDRPPVNTLPSSFSGTEDTPLVLAGISATDPDGGSASEQVTFSVNAGILTLSTTVSGGLTTAQVNGNGTAALVITALFP